MNDWSDFYVATAGASAALTGLLFVGVSISLTKILAVPALPDRALLSIVLLMTTLIVSLFGLVPEQSVGAMGAEVMAVGAVAWLASLGLDLRVWRRIDRRYRRRYAFYIAANQITTALFIGAGAAMMAEASAGMYVLLPALLLSIVKSVADAWVFLIEINR